MVVELEHGMRSDVLLFGETQSRILLTLPRTSLPRAEKIFSEREVPHRVLGTVGGSRLKITVGKEAAINVAVADLLKAWSEAFPALVG